MNEPEKFCNQLTKDELMGYTSNTVERHFSNYGGFKCKDNVPYWPKFNIFNVERDNGASRVTIETKVRIQRGGKWYAVFVSDWYEYMKNVQVAPVLDMFQNFTNTVCKVQNLYILNESDSQDNIQIDEKYRIELLLQLKYI